MIDGGNMGREGGGETCDMLDAVRSKLSLRPRGTLLLFNGAVKHMCC